MMLASTMMISVRAIVFLLFLISGASAEIELKNTDVVRDLEGRLDEKKIENDNSAFNDLKIPTFDKESLTTIKGRYGRNLQILDYYYGQDGQDYYYKNYMNNGHDYYYKNSIHKYLPMPFPPGGKKGGGGGAKNKNKGMDKDKNKKGGKRGGTMPEYPPKYMPDYYYAKDYYMPYFPIGKNGKKGGNAGSVGGKKAPSLPIYTPDYYYHNKMPDYYGTYSDYYSSHGYPMPGGKKGGGKKDDYYGKYSPDYYYGGTYSDYYSSHGYPMPGGKKGGIGSEKRGKKGDSTGKYMPDYYYGKYSPDYYYGETYSDYYSKYGYPKPGGKKGGDKKGSSGKKGVDPYAGYLGLGDYYYGSDYYSKYGYPMPDGKKGGDKKGSGGKKGGGGGGGGGYPGMGDYYYGGYYGEYDPCLYYRNRRNLQAMDYGMYEYYMYNCPHETPSPAPTTSPTSEAPTQPYINGQECQSDADCAALPQCQGVTCVCFLGYKCVTEGSLRFSLAYLGEGNLDLQLITPPPDNELVSVNNPFSFSGAEFDLVSGDQAGSPDDAFMYVESIFFPDGVVPPTGLYTMVAEQTSGFPVDVDVNYIFEVYQGGVPIYAFPGTFFAYSAEQTQVFYVTI